jgi:hypothetical protein
MELALESLNISIEKGYPAAYVNMAMVPLTTGDRREADSIFRTISVGAPSLERIAAEFGMTVADYMSALVAGYFDVGLRAENRRLLPKTGVRANSLIAPSMMLKDGEHLTSWLDDSTFNRYLIITYLFAPPFRDMLNQPAMKAYLNSVGLPDFWRANKWPDFCRPLGDDDFECQDVNGNYP